LKKKKAKGLERSVKRYSRISFTYLFFASVDFVNEVTSSGMRVWSLSKWRVARFEVTRGLTFTGPCIVILFL